MDLDVDKLVLVEARPALYDYNMKDLFNKDVIGHLWDEVLKEIYATGKTKFLNLTIHCLGIAISGISKLKHKY